MTCKFEYIHKFDDYHYHHHTSYISRSTFVLFFLLSNKLQLLCDTTLCPIMFFNMHLIILLSVLWMFCFVLLYLSPNCEMPDLEALTWPEEGAHALQMHHQRSNITFGQWHHKALLSEDTGSGGSHQCSGQPETSSPAQDGHPQGCYAQDFLPTVLHACAFIPFVSNIFLTLLKYTTCCTY